MSKFRCIVGSVMAGVVLSLTGCSSFSDVDIPFMKKTPGQIGEKMDTVVSSVSSIEGVLKTDIVFQDESSIEWTADFTVIPDDVVHISGVQSDVDMHSSVDMYREYGMEDVSTYVSVDEGDWSRNDLAMSDNMDFILSGNAFANSNAEQLADETVNNIDAYVLTRMITGSELEDVLSCFTLYPNDSFDASSSDMKLTLWIDKDTYFPVKQVLTSSDTGLPMSYGSGSDMKPIDMITITTEFCGFNTVDSFSVPEVLSDYDSNDADGIQVNWSTDEVSSDGMSDVMIASDDGMYQVSFRPYDDLTSVSESDNALQISGEHSGLSSSFCSIAFDTGLDAYSSADSDRGVALSYYNTSEYLLSEVYVSDVKTTTTDGYPVYFYSRQYTDSEYGFVSQEYAMYIELNSDCYLRVLLSGITDPGVSVPFDDAYVQTVLDHIGIIAL